MALVALPLLLLLFLTAPREPVADASESSAEGVVSRRPAAALVAPADDARGDDDGGLSPLALAALVGVGLVPTFVLIGRRRQNRHLPN
ncbi:MAG TPA: hypothetical protein VFU21_24035 [Kofleriaceae bacterium]|nr:hypothetical protein [Kofleriaceae bacterium]